MTTPTRTLTVTGTKTLQRLLTVEDWFGVTYEYVRFNGGHQMCLLPCVDQPGIIPMMETLHQDDAKEVADFPSDVTRIEVTSASSITVTAFSLNEDNPDLEMEPIEQHGTTCTLLPRSIQIDGVEVFAFDEDDGYWKHLPTGKFYSDLNFTARKTTDEQGSPETEQPQEATSQSRLEASLRTALSYLNAIPNTKPKGFDKSTYEVIPHLQSALH